MSGRAEGGDGRERPEPGAGGDPLHGPEAPPHKQEPKQSHAGNGTVNHHLDDQSPDGLDSDELALRRMLHQAVQDMEPRDGTLDHLRHAVPARRARKRQAAVGMAAAALFVGTAVPALWHVSGAGDADANPAMAGQASEAQGGAGEGKVPDGGSSGKAGGSAGQTGAPGGDTTKSDGPGKDPGGTDGSSSASDQASPSAPALPACTPSQLGQSTADVQVPDSAGIVYGTFRVVNVSGSGCVVGGKVSVTPTAQGAADPTKITVVEHTSGDAAAALPDPSLYVPQLSLAPGSAYDVKFAWVPSETCPTTGGNGGGDSGGSASPDPSPSEQAGPTGGTTTGTDSTSTQMLVEDGTADGSVQVTYAAEGGVPTVTATVPNACAGVIYRTGVLASS